MPKLVVQSNITHETLQSLSPAATCAGVASLLCALASASAAARVEFWLAAAVRSMAAPSKLASFSGERVLGAMSSAPLFWDCSEEPCSAWKSPPFWALAMEWGVPDCRASRRRGENRRAGSGGAGFL